MTRTEALSRLLALGVTRKAAGALLRAAESSGSASGSGVWVGCHPYMRRYYVSRA